VVGSVVEDGVATVVVDSEVAFGSDAMPSSTDDELHAAARTEMASNTEAARASFMAESLVMAEHHKHGRGMRHEGPSHNDSDWLSSKVADRRDTKSPLLTQLVSC